MQDPLRFEVVPPVGVPSMGQIDVSKIIYIGCGPKKKKKTLEATKQKM